MRHTLSFLALVCLLVACAGPEIPELHSGWLTFAGSTTAQPLIAKLGEAYRARHPGVEFEFVGGGSVVGIQLIHAGTVDVGMASRALRPDEAQGVESYRIATDVLAMVVHPTNLVETLTRVQLYDVYLGRVTNWAEVGGRDQAITVLVRDENSGTRGAFDELVLDRQAPAAPNMVTTATAGDMVARVAAIPGAIGYAGFGGLGTSTKTLRINGVAPTLATVRDGTYNLVRPLLLLIGPSSRPEARDFVDFALSADGQRLVEQDGWLPAR
jgi:phosphate transport system substrate-binding protein